MPIVLADATLEYARHLDNSTKSTDTSDLSYEITRLKDEIEALKQELAKEKQTHFNTEAYGARVYEDLRLQFVLANAEWQRLLKEEGEWATRLGEVLIENDKLCHQLGEVRSQLETLQTKNERLKTNQVTEFESLEASDLLNRLKAKRKKSTASLTDVEALLEMIEES